jgi:hypothetical protein
MGKGEKDPWPDKAPKKDPPDIQRSLEIALGLVITRRP